MTLDDSLLILANIELYFFYENDTNEVQNSYHNDCLEKREREKKTKKKKKNKKKTTYFAY